MDVYHRLDDMHDSLKEYLGNQLSFAPIEGMAPKRILEMGCGTGAWAIQAAQAFPNAEVVAVDIAPLPDRPLPPNLKFHTLNLTQAFPFEAETFDIVHARFVFIHLPMFEDVLKRTVQLIKPRGWLLIEDADTLPHGTLPPNIQFFWEQLRTFQKSVGSNPMAASMLPIVLQSTCAFSEMNVKQVYVPITRVSPTQCNDEIRRLSGAIRTFYLRALVSSGNASHFTSGVAEAAADESNDPELNIRFNMMFIWARKE
ncbi:S-adenosyl-L-methionine-dependent methyltransferase [Ramaria rubella]|nr:S-adenosyl-L-methionine-dependent methyltransferase [Ramaria rubella]